MPHMTLMRSRVQMCAVAAVLLSMVGCACSQRATIQHVVLLKLDNPDQAAALKADCDRLLPAIEGVVEYWSGTPDQSGRVSPAMDQDWDVAVCVGYPDAAAYEAYVVDPKHVELGERWRPRLAWWRVHDVAVDGQ